MSLYERLQAADPGGDINEAFDTLSKLTYDTHPVALYGYTSIAAELGSDTANALEDAIAATTKTAPYNIGRWVGERLNGDGIDVNAPDVPAMLAAFQAGGYLTEAQKDAILSLGLVKVLKFPGLQIGELMTARDMTGV